MRSHPRYMKWEESVSARDVERYEAEFIRRLKVDVGADINGSHHSDLQAALFMYPLLLDRMLRELVCCYRCAGSVVQKAMDRDSAFSTSASNVTRPDGRRTGG